jgi:hypothetical protein
MDQVIDAAMARGLRADAHRGGHRAGRGATALFIFRNSPPDGRPGASVKSRKSPPTDRLGTRQEAERRGFGGAYRRVAQPPRGYAWVRLGSRQNKRLV